MQKRDHGGGIDAAAEQYGGAREDWLDLSTGINPVAYPLPEFDLSDWTALPDAAAFTALEAAARAFWDVPEGAEVLACHGASAPIAALAGVLSGRQVSIDEPTYNEHRAGFEAHGWQVCNGAPVRVIVNPNNPTGRWYEAAELGEDVVIIDESFADVDLPRSMISEAGKSGRVVLKSFGKFWGLAGLRLGFVIGDPALVRPLRARLGPWAVSGPALRAGAEALRNDAWAAATRRRLVKDAARLDVLVGAKLVGGTPLFRLYDVGDAAAFQARLAGRQIWTRIFPYSDRWVRLGLPDAAGFERLEAVL